MGVHVSSMIERTAVAFRSGGETCRGDLFLPETDDAPPVVILAHGFGGERSWCLPRTLADSPRADWLRWSSTTDRSATATGGRGT